MKILIVSQYFWPESFKINDLACELQKQGHEITVLTGMPNYPEGQYFTGYSTFSPRTETYNSITIKRVPLVPRGNSNSLRLILNYLSFAFTASILAPFYCKEKCDAIFVFQTSPVTVGIPAVLLKKLKKAKLFFWIQDLWPETLLATKATKSKFIYKIFEKLSAWLYKNSDKILIQCKGFAKSVKDKNISDDKIAYFPNWADVPSVTETITPENMPEGFIVMFAGNLGTSQALDTIVAAAEKLKTHSDIHFVILGDGRQAEWMKKQVENKSLQHQVHFLGRHPASHMPAYFECADVLLVTLNRDPVFALTIPSKIQAYLAAGKPIIGALDGFAADVIKESNAGFSGDAEDADALAENILRCYNLSKTELQQLGLNAKQYSDQEFNREKLIRQLTEWLSKA